MAQQRNQSDSEKLSCSICLDLLKDPVSTSCGHDYCMDCIKTHWDGEDGKRIYSCPQCRKTFTPRPVLEKHVLLADLVEELKKTRLQAAAAEDDDDLCYAGPGDVSCDSCTGRKLKAFKSCLFCLVSFCEQHLQPHYQSPAFKKHQLVEPSKNLQENICSRHDEVMKIFCLTDQQLICSLCSLDEHKGHESVSAAAERKKKQKELEVSRLNVQQRIQDRQKDVKMLQQELEDIRVCADRTVEDNEKMFSEMIQLIHNRQRDVEQQIRSQQKTEESRVKELQEKLEQEIRDLKRKDAELKQLSDTPDHSQFLHNYPSVSALSESKPSSSIDIRNLRHFEDVTAAVKELRDHLQNILRDTWTNISLAITEVDVLLSEPQPKTRDGFLKYSREITLDPTTAHSFLLLSEGNRKVTFMKENQSYPDHPDRFTVWFQVLSKESLTGRCYWEVEWRGGHIEVSVAKKNICRKGNSKECRFGCNDKSWSLICSTNSYTFRYNNIITTVSGPESSRIGVYLDHRAGILSFYSISETMTLLHRVQTTFTEPLHAGVWLSYDVGNTAEFLKVKQYFQSLRFMFSPDLSSRHTTVQKSGSLRNGLILDRKAGFVATSTHLKQLLPL
ncbi:tripartite motif-containing protein 16-like [Amphiprion ocellaris]|uniref:tripartite motif-containing protein 16-like n=1 Tax=Amphiprion ocellaris TaxID=80972 RepID=UPI0024117AD4|nr:tripartite motif-containing protein 16-like [Amphiprion ocellaris]